MSQKAIKSITELTQESVSSLFTRGVLRPTSQSNIAVNDELNKRVGLYRGAVLDFTDRVYLF